MTNSVMDVSQFKHIHFIGIGGVGMSALAHIMLLKGYRVSGSDMRENIHTIQLKDQGAQVFVGHDPNHVKDVDLVVVSSAVRAQNSELAQAVEDDLPVIRRSELLAWVMAQYPRSIAVAGTHGKTTTTSMITRVLIEAQLDPTYVIGATMQDYGLNAGMGNGSYVVAESDESDGSFLCLHPHVAVVTNVELEHMDYYDSLDQLLDHFRRFVSDVCERGGYVVMNSDDPHYATLAKGYEQQIISFSVSGSAQAAVRAADIRFSSQGTHFDVWVDGVKKGPISLTVFGVHHVSNALATIGVALREGVPFSKIQTGLQSFLGAKRRLQLIGVVGGVSVYDDYAHHPTEVACTLQGVKSCLNQPLICVFQPHRYTRLQAFFDGFIDAFKLADRVILTDVYAANEPAIDGISSERLALEMQRRLGISVQYVAKKSEVPQVLVGDLKSGDVVVTMGAGDIGSVGGEICAQLQVLQERQNSTRHAKP